MAQHNDGPDSTVSLQDLAPCVVLGSTNSTPCLREPTSSRVPQEIPANETTLSRVPSEIMQTDDTLSLCQESKYFSRPITNRICTL